MCNNCTHKAVCSIYRATGGKKQCEHYRVAHGRWVKDGDVVYCSNCGEEHEWEDYRAPFCEDCGCDMRGGSDD